MGILHNVYFLISPKENLVSKIKSIDIGDGIIIELITEKAVWKTKSSDPQDYSINQVKLVHLAEMYSFFSEDGVDPRNLEIFRQIIGEAPYSEHTFDEWWKLQSIFLNELEQVVKDDIPQSILKLFNTIY